MRGEEEKGILCTRNSELGRGNEVKGWGWGDEETDLVTHVGESRGAGGGYEEALRRLVAERELSSLSTMVRA